MAAFIPTEKRVRDGYVFSRDDVWAKGDTTRRFRKEFSAWLTVNNKNVAATERANLVKLIRKAKTIEEALTLLGEE